MMTSETELAGEEVLAHSRAGAGFEAVLANAAFGAAGAPKETNCVSSPLVSVTSPF